MRATTALRFWVGLAAAAIGACAPDLDLDPPSSVQLGLAGDDSCQTNSCGNGNSPVIDGVYFWRLNLKGEVGPESVKVVGVTAPWGAPMRLELVAAEGDRLRGVVADRRTTSYVEHKALVGTKISLSLLVGAEIRYYQIEIVGVTLSDKFWVGAQASIEAYKFAYRPIVNNIPMTQVPLCSDEDGVPTELDALVFGGDRYTPATKAIEDEPMDNGWINVACYASAIYKMHKIGYTAAAGLRNVIVKTASIDQRRAMLNAWTANLCGDGHSTTRQGALIALRESAHVTPDDFQYPDPLAAEVQFEAIWHQGGVYCFDQHRLALGDDAFTKAKRQACSVPPPTCTEEDRQNWEAHGYVATGAPAP